MELSVSAATSAASGTSVAHAAPLVVMLHRSITLGSFPLGEAELQPDAATCCSSRWQTVFRQTIEEALLGLSCHMCTSVLNRAPAGALRLHWAAWAALLCAAHLYYLNLLNPDSPPPHRCSGPLYPGRRGPRCCGRAGAHPGPPTWASAGRSAAAPPWCPPSTAACRWA